MKKIKVLTDFPDAFDSPDFLSPLGAIQDNHSNEIYLADLERIAKNKPYSYMDLGCAGGQSVIDVYDKGYVSCGLEGSDLNAMLNESSPHTGVALNWEKYKDICLFKADITKPFTVVDEDNELVKFDIITAWDVLEHPRPEQIPKIIDNIINHLSDDGVFIALINIVRGHHHQCIKSESWWLDTFEKKGLISIGFDMNSSPRHTTYPIGKNDFGFMFKLK